MKEKLVIIFIASVLGLLLTTAVFYLYQSTKTIPEKNVELVQKDNDLLAATPTLPQGNVMLTIEEPKDEMVVNKRTIELKGKTNPTNTLIISSNIEDVVINPTSDGTYASSVQIDTGVNKITVRAIAPNGDERTEEITLTYTTEDF